MLSYQFDVAVTAVRIDREIANEDVRREKGALHALFPKDSPFFRHVAAPNRHVGIRGQVGIDSDQLAWKFDLNMEFCSMRIPSAGKGQ